LNANTDHIANLPPCVFHIYLFVCFNFQNRHEKTDSSNRGRFFAFFDTVVGEILGDYFCGFFNFWFEAELLGFRGDDVGRHDACFYWNFPL